MKPQTYFRFAFFIPLILWVISLVISLIISGKDLAPLENALLIPIAAYAIGIIFWFFPYVILVIGMWIWNKNRNVSTLQNAGLAAPFIFYLLMMAEVSVVYFGTDGVGNLQKDFLGISAMFAVLSLVFGYFCVGIALGIYKILQARNFILQETPMEY